MGLFEHYPADAAAAETAGDRATDQKATYGALKENLSSQSDQASQEASGVVELPVKDSTDERQKEAKTAGDASLVAGGAMKHFASAIQTYDDRVDELNEEYETAKADDFGVAADAGHEGGNTDAENDAARDGLVDEARGDKKAELEKKRKDYEADLDDSADYAASLLIAGPTDETIISLVATGDISVDDAAEALGVSVGELNEWRGTLGVGLTIKSWKKALPALLSQNADELAKALEPGNLFGKEAAKYIGRHRFNLGSYTGKHKLTKLMGFGRLAGKVLPPLSVYAGMDGLDKSMDNIAEDGGDFDDWNNAVGSTATIVSGGISSYALVAGAALVPGIGWTVAGVAGAIAVGSWAIDNQEEIEEVVTDVGSAIGSGLSAVGDALSDVWW